VIRNPVLRSMLGMSLLVAGAASSEVEPVGAANDPSRPATDLATDPKLIPVNRALSDGCDLVHPRSKRCSTEGHQCHHLTKSQRRAIREINSMHRPPGVGRENG